MICKKSIYNRKHWHALSHSLQFVRHEGRLATIGGTRLTRAMAANEPGFLYTRCGTSSSSYRGMSSGWPARWSLVLVQLLVLRMTAEPLANAPAVEVLCFSYFSHLVCWSVFVSSWFTGLSKFSLTKFRFAFCSPPVTVKVLFVPVNSIWAAVLPVCVQTMWGRRNPKLFNL